MWHLASHWHLPHLNQWMQVWHHLSQMSWYFSVLVAQLLEDSSAAISVLQLPLLYLLPLFYAVRDSLRRPLKCVGDSRSRFLNEIAFSIIQWLWHKKSKHWLFCSSNRERAHYYMSIMKEAHSKMRNNGESDVYGWRSRQFDILQAKEATFLSVDGCSGRASELSMPGYHWSPVIEVNWTGLSKSTEEWW